MSKAEALCCIDLHATVLHEVRGELMGLLQLQSHVAISSAASSSTPSSSQLCQREAEPSHQDAT